MDLGDFQRLFEGQFGQDGGNSAGEHGLAAARRPHEQDIVSAGDRYFQRPSRHGLPLDEGEIAGGSPPLGRRGKFGGGDGREREGAREMSDDLFEVGGGKRPDTADIPRLSGVGGGDDEIGKSVVPRGDEGGQHPLHGAEFAA